MDIRQLEAFVHVAKAGSMTAASQEMYISAPALVQQINRLENEVGITLFHRSSRGVVLTPAGEAFYLDAQRVLDMTAHMLQSCQEAAGQQAAVVRIGSISGLVPDIYPKIFQEIKRLNVPVRLEHVEDTPNGLRNALLEEKIDLIEYYDGPLAHHPELQYVPIVYEGRNCLMMPEHHLAKQPLIKPEELSGEHVYVYEFERVPGLREEMKKRCPEVYIEESKGKPINYYATLSVCQEGGICMIPPHCDAYFAPLRSVPLDVGLRWSSGLICRRKIKEPVRRVIESAIRAYDAPAT